MKPQLYVPALTPAQRRSLQHGLRSKEAFTARRCRILLRSADRQAPSRIARDLGCTAPTVRHALHAFAAEGLACLKEKSSRPHAAKPALGADRADDLKDLLHHRPRAFGKATGLWTLDLLADVCHAKGWTPRRLTGEAVRVALRRLGIRWRRAKRWITSPDPAYARKKSPATA